ncbi:MAG: hypothetical protein HYS13_03730 [Planctomycetia bacterium]|nr:hypothetical protein [Planctomycetia bacterium]
MKTIVLCSVVVFTAMAAVLQAGDDCGCADCQLVCKLVCTWRTVEVTCYGYKCEDFCMPGPSEKCQEHCEPIDKCDLLCHLRWTEWCPDCAAPYHRKKLTKYVVKRDVPSYKWVVVPACQCAAPAPGTHAKRAPRDAEPGDEFPVTEAELRQLSEHQRLARGPARQ